MKQALRQLVVHILTAEAKLLLRRKNPTIIAVTGSVGKTSTKDAIYAAIKETLPARKSQKSYNSEFGVPLTVLGLPTGWDSPARWLWNIIDGAFTALFTKTYPAVLVLETGVDTPGDMDILTAWLKPDVVVITRLPDVPVHVEQFKTPQEVINEKMKLVHNMNQSGVVIYNHDDPIIIEQLKEVRQKTIGYGRYLPTDVMVQKDSVYYQDDVPAGVSFAISHNQEQVDIRLAGIVGLQHSYGCAAAIAVASHLGVTLAAGAAGLARLSTPPGRLRVIPGIKGTVLIDDTYNSSPIAAEHAIETVSTLKHNKRRIAVLGDMLELGQFSASEHKRIGEQVVKHFDVLLTIGVRARGFAEGALAAGMDESTIFQYEKVERAGRELQAMLEPGDLVLVKASQGIRAEKIVKEVMAEPLKAEQLLVRQDSAWQTR